MAIKRRPQKKFDRSTWAQLETLCSLNASKKMCSDILGCSEDTIKRRIKSEYKCTFEEYREKHLNKTKVKLIQTAIKRAIDGNNTMLIFCLKNLCGWSDKTNIETSGVPSMPNVIVQIPSNSREGEFE